MSEMIEIARLKRDEATQPRAYIDDSAVEDYAADMARGDVFPPVIVFHDGINHWLGDGFHRVESAESLGLTEIAADIRMGTYRDAVLFACGANHGQPMRRTQRDKRRAVVRLLDDPEWAKWSDYEIARVCKVSDDLVRYVRAERAPASLSASGSEIDPHLRTYRTKHGTVATMNTAAIGRRRSEDDDPLAGGAGDDRAQGAPPSRPPGFRERDIRNPGLQIESTLLSVRHAMSVLPAATVVAAAVPHFDMDEADRFAMWWTDFAEELRDRAERAA